MARKSARKTQRPAADPPARSPEWILWAVTALTVFSGLAFLLSKISLLDEGVLNMGAWRVAQGQVPYRDFFLPTTPLAWYALGGFFRILGVGLLQERVFAAIVGLALVGLTLLLARRLTSSPLFAALPVAFLCQAGMSTWPFANHHWLADVLVLGSALSMDFAAEGRPFPRAFAAGILAALAFWSLHDQGLYFLVLATLLALPWKEGALRNPVVKGWTSGLASGLVPPALFLLWKAGFPALWDALVLFPLTGYKGIEGNRLSILFPLTEIALPWRSDAWKAAPLYYAVLTATSFLIFVTFFAAPLLLAVARWKKWAPDPRWGLLAAGALAFMGAAAHRWGPINLMWAIPFPALVAAWALQRWDSSERTPRSRWAKRLAMGFAVLFCALGALRVWTLARPDGAHPIHTPAGTLFAQNARQALALQEAVDVIHGELGAQDPLLVSQMPLLQFMVQRPNPTRFDLFMPPDYTTPAQVREVLRALDASAVRWVVTPRKRPSDDAFGRYLIENFQPIWGNPIGILWQRMDHAPGTPFTGDPAPPSRP